MGTRMQGYGDRCEWATGEERRPELEPIEIAQREIWHGIERGIEGQLRSLIQEALEQELKRALKAESYEPTPRREGYRNGCYRRGLGTTYGNPGEVEAPSSVPARSSPPSHRNVNPGMCFGLRTTAIGIICGGLPDTLSGFAGVLLSLRQREALAVGEATTLPSWVMIRKLTSDQPPRSQDMDFSSGWQNPTLGLSPLASIGNLCGYETRSE